MKRIFAIILSFLALASPFLSNAAMLSPALDIISDSEEMTVSLSRTLPRFKTEFFTDALGCDEGNDELYLTVTSLPENGSLKYLSNNVYVGQTLSLPSLKSLSYDTDGIKNCDSDAFTFSVCDSYEVLCNIKICDTVNFAPATEDGTLAVSADSSAPWHGTLNAGDPEKDELVYQIEEYPKKGLLTLTDKNSGEYVYSPYAGSRGSDSFSYRVRDSHGNFSEICTVKINTKKDNTFVFSDTINENIH